MKVESRFIGEFIKHGVYEEIRDNETQWIHWIPLNVVHLYRNESSSYYYNYRISIGNAYWSQWALAQLALLPLVSSRVRSWPQEPLSACVNYQSKKEKKEIPNEWGNLKFLASLRKMELLMKMMGIWASLHPWNFFFVLIRCILMIPLGLKGE